MTDDTVTAKLAEWEALAEGATPGVWFPVDENGGAPGTPPAWTVSRTAATGDYAGDVVYLPAPLTDRGMDGQYAADAEFIAAARTAMPALLAAVQDVLRVCDERRGGCGDDYTDGWTAGWADALLEVRRAITQQIGGEG